MSNGNAALALALGAGAGLGLYHLLRDDDEKQETAPGTGDPAQAAAAPNPTRASGTATAAPSAPSCALRLDAKGLTADGLPIDIPTAVTKCQAAARADLVLADDAPSTVYADLAAAFNTAGILITQRRNGRRKARARRAPLPWVRAGDRVRLADHVRSFPAYGSKPAVTRATVLEVERVIGRGSKRDPYRVVLTDGAHSWHVDPDGVVIVEHGFGRRQTARPPRYLAWCGTCYSGARLETNSRRAASSHATSHMRLYPGHDVHVTDRRKRPTRDDRNAPTYERFTLRIYPEGTKAGAQLRHFHADPATSWKDAYYRLIAAGIVDARRAGQTREPGGWMLSVVPAQYRADRAEALP